MDKGVAIAVLCVGVGGIAAQWLAWRFKLPAIVLLFLAGLLFGPVLGIIHPGAALGPVMRPAIGLAVAIVVFEGGLALEFSELRAAGSGVFRLTAVALPICFVLASVAAHVVGQFAWGSALLFGAITVVTGPTVILPMLRHTRLTRRASSFLKWEAIVNDPIGAILATIVLQVLIEAKGNHVLAADLAARIGFALAVSAALGVGAAYAIRFAFARDHVQERLKTPLLLVGAMTVYALANLVMEGAGLAAATLLGVALANLGVHGLSELRRFKESLVVLIVSGLFIVLTANLPRSTLAQLSWPIMWLTLAALFIVRPAGIWLATIGSGLTLAERTLAGWVAPRGIVAAAVAGAAGLRLADAGYAGGSLVMPAVFALIAATTVLHGFTLGPVARRLGLTLSDRPGLAILGASSWSTDMAAALCGAGVPVLLIDSFPGALDAARSRGVPVLQAEILSAHGNEELEGRPVDYFIAATPDDIYNGLVCARLAPELGRERVLQISPGARHLDAQRGLSREARGKVMGNAAWDHSMFEESFAGGWRFRVAEESGEPGDVALITLRAGGAIVVHSTEDPVDAAPGDGDQTLVFRPAEADEGDAALIATEEKQTQEA